MMCGIWARAGGSSDGLDAILAALPGPAVDAVGTWAEGPLALGWRGRAIAADRGTERCPRSASGLAITASVRLDGRAALCEALGVSYRDRAGLPDSALILKSYARWGRACPEHLFGDYAFAVWDARRQVLFCARDHIGVRPFYYSLPGDRFVFASVLGAVLAAPGVADELDEEVVATALTYGARPLGNRTRYRGVFRLLPGHSLTVERNRVRLERWWRPEEAPALPPASDAVLAEECLAILSEAVRDRVRGTRRIGVHLSGGLDSSTVAALAARELRREGRPAPPAFAWLPPPGPGPDGRAEAAEYSAIDSVCARENLPICYAWPELRDVVAFLRGDGSRSAVGSHLHEGLVQRAAAARDVEIILSGWGGDEGISFNGRGFYPLLLRTGRWGRLWREIRERHRYPFAALLAEAALPLFAPRAAEVARRLRRGEAPVRKNVTFIHPAFARRARLLPAERPWPVGGRVRQIRLVERGHLAARMERWRASGADYGIEYAYPLLDRRVLEFALGLPPEQYRRGRWSRWIMRRALSPVLPDQVCWAAKGQDQVRSNAINELIGKALPAVRGMIEKREGSLSRGRYLDLPRLIKELDPERWRAGARHAPVLKALRFLDF